MLLYVNMALEYYELNIGDPKAAQLARDLREAHGDVPLPIQNGSSPKPAEIKRFSDEAVEALLKRDFVIHDLNGESIASLRGAGRRFWSTWHRDYPEFEAKTSRLTQVAINPDPERFFLPESNRKTLKQQEEMIAKFSKELASGKNRIKGVVAIMGEMPDYVELAFRHLDATQKYLFGPDYDYNYARTKTLSVGSDVANVGYFDPDHGLSIGYWHRGKGYDNVWAVPLVVPA